MMSLKESPAVKSAFDFVKTNIDQGTWKPGERLASVRKLARACGVSTSTMAKVISLLKRAGLVTATQRLRMRVTGPIAANEEAEKDLSHLERIRMRLEADLLSGAIENLPQLPSSKELQARYDVSYGTMHKIMAAMVVDKVIVPQGKGYALPEVKAGTNRRHIMYITCVGHYAQESALNHEHNRIVNLFENECYRRGLHLEVVEFDFSDPQSIRIAMMRLPKNELTVGYVLDVWWYTALPFQQSYLEILSRLRSRKRPVAILDELGTFSLPTQYYTNPLLQVYTIEAARAGERMARFLIRLGHRSVVYVSVVHGSPWSQDRFNGILKQFERVGSPDRVHLVADTVEVLLPNILSHSGVADIDVRKFITIGRTPLQAADLERQWVAFKHRRESALSGYPRLDPLMSKNLSALAAVLRKPTHELFLSKTGEGALNAASIEVYATSLIPAFERALLHTDATAWICANDQMAFGALEFLRRHKIRVPHDISVVGFDNLPLDALEKGLTTFDFNAQGFIHNMLNFILRPPRPRGRYRHSVVEIEGIIIERGSAGPVKK